MSRKNISQKSQPKSNRKNNRRAKTSISLPLRYRLLMLACGLVIVVGFFFAARQHFASVDFSMKNSKLRKMSEELEADKRRLLLAKEIALSPTELKKAAQKIGFTTTNAAKNIAEIARGNGKPTTNNKTEKPRAEKSELAKAKQVIVEKTEELVAVVKPVVRKLTETKLTETKSPDTRARRVSTQAER